ncbi:ESX-1 secreted protein, EspB [Mycobacterium lentiflavum]|uniref:ESX-1 secreted protein, EspB n=1 Tax=Mycobacterium lentiflavum TaxID=141349 RepID=A0A0E3WD03_MYCLN|nr:hypothetical protein [Mycobacterium lentiflavum]CQD17320.1 ESX-1 secreted protein, EspB [Mycobacterium lentiflavum]
MAEMLKVEYDELMARAAELEVPLPAPPPGSARPPCAISFVVDSGTQLDYSASAIRESIKRAEAEYLVLAESLRNAALAYEEADQAAADALTEGSSATPESASTPPAQKTGAGESFAAPPETPGYDGYYDLRKAIEDIEAPDQGPAYTKFAADWNSYVLALQADVVMQRFRPFEYWEGESAAAVEANFESQKKWLIQLGNSSCFQIASQARGVVDAHKWAVTVHPTSYDLYVTDYWYDEYGRRGDITRQSEVLAWYVDMQERSETVLADYNQRAAVPLSLVYPSNPPAAVAIKAPLQIPDNAGEIIRGAIGGVVDAGTGGTSPGALASQLGNANVADTVSSLSNMASSQSDTASDPFATTPSTPLPTGMPGLPKAGGVKPASFGGGGMPSMPLQSATDAGAGSGGSTRPAASGVGAGPGAGGATAGRGAMGGGMPMGAGAGQGQGKDSKAKRYGEEEDIYTEDRPWTSSVVGSRRRNEASDDGPK